MSHRDIVDDEHLFSSLDGWSVGEDHPDFRRHVMGILDLKGSWEENLPLVESTYNNSYQARIQMTYEALYGRSCRSPVC